MMSHLLNFCPNVKTKFIYVFKGASARSDDIDNFDSLDAIFRALQFVFPSHGCQIAVQAFLYHHMHYVVYTCTHNY